MKPWLVIQFFLQLWAVTAGSNGCNESFDTSINEKSRQIMMECIGDPQVESVLWGAGTDFKHAGEIFIKGVGFWYKYQVKFRIKNDENVTDIVYLLEVSKGDLKLSSEQFLVDDEHSRVCFSRKPTTTNLANDPEFHRPSLEIKINCVILKEDGREICPIPRSPANITPGYSLHNKDNQSYSGYIDQEVATKNGIGLS